MELQCPGCLKRLTIPDPFAGQMVKCPLCAGMFVAPALPAKPVTVAPIVAPVVAPVVAPIAPPMPAMELPVAPPPPHPDVIPFSGEPLVVPPSPPLPPPSYTPPLPPPPEPPRYLDVESDPVPHGDHTRKRTLVLRPHILRWATPVCLAVMFLLSFFDWMALGIVSMNLWGMAFHADGPGRYVVYVVFTLFLALPLSWMKLCFEKNWLPMPAALGPFWPWRSVVVGGLLLLAFVVPFFDTLRWNLASPMNPMGFGMKLALRAHLVAIVASGLEYWLLSRSKTSSPLPDLTIRW